MTDRTAHRPRLLIVDDMLLPVFDRFRKEVSPRAVIVWSHGNPVPEGFIDYEQMIEPEMSAFTFIDHIFNNTNFL